ncbi:GNAT family N-acetyltransferase [soil metagenome]
MHTIVHLTLDRLEDLRAARVPCAGCLRWELDPVRRGRVQGDAATAAEKEGWLTTVLREWGSCGRVVLVDAEVAGYVAYAPAAFVPGSHAFATAPVSTDAVLLTTAYLAPEHRGVGLGRMLVQAMAADLVERGGVHAVEAFGRSPVILAPGGSCLVPSDFLARVGFKTVRPHRSTPRMRMDLRSTVTWRDEVEAALGRLVGAVRPSGVRAPETARSLRDAKGPA